MDPISAFFAALGALGNLGGLGVSMGSRQKLDQSLAPGGLPGTLTPQQAGGLDLGGVPQSLGAGPNSDAITNMLRGASTNVSGFPLLMAGQVAEQDALRTQRGYAQNSLDQVRSGSLAQAEKSAGDLVTRNPEVIDQATYDRMVNQFFQQNNAAAASRERQIGDMATAQNLSPDALAAMRIGNAESNSFENNAAARDLSVTRQLENRKGLERAIQQAAQVGQAYNQQLGAANSDVASTFQPIDWASLGGVINQDAMLKLMLQQEADAALANSLFGMGGGAWNNFTSRRNSQRQANAMGGGGLFGGGRSGSQLGQSIGTLGALGAGMTGLVAPEDLFLEMLLQQQGGSAIGSLFG